MCVYPLFRKIINSKGKIGVKGFENHRFLPVFCISLTISNSYVYFLSHRLQD